MQTLTDPSGAARGTTDSRDPEDFLRLAWGLGPDDFFTVLANDCGAWELFLYRKGREPATTPLTIRSRYIPSGYADQTKVAMIEAAWHDLTDEGWAVRS